MNFTMATYTCQEHGQYQVPEFVTRRWCPECSFAFEADFDTEAHRYRVGILRWETWRACGIAVKYANRTLENWQPAGKLQALAVEQVRGVLSDIIEKPGLGMGFTLLSPPGVGKTHLLHGAVHELHNAGIRAFYAVWPDVLSRQKASFNDREQPDAKILERLARAPVLALDEIGTRAGSEFDTASLFDLIDRRYSANLPTLLATNLTAGALDNIGERTADRLRECTYLIAIDGESRRGKLTVSGPPAIERPDSPVVEREVTINGQRQTFRRAPTAGRAAAVGRA